MAEHTDPGNKSADAIELEGLLAWRYSVDGYSTPEIAEIMKLSLRTVQRRISESILAREMPSRDAAKLLELDRLDRAHRDVMTERAAGDGDAARSAHAVAALSRQRSKILGLDAPTKVEHLGGQVSDFSPEQQAEWSQEWGESQRRIDDSERRDRPDSNNARVAWGSD
jgi:hypothetical protein